MGIKNNTEWTPSPLDSKVVMLLVYSQSSSFTFSYLWISLLAKIYNPQISSQGAFLVIWVMHTVTKIFWDRMDDEGGNYIYVYIHIHTYIHEVSTQFLFFVFAKQVLYHLSHASSPFFSRYFGDGSCKVFAGPGLKLWSSQSQPPY
jgi:hypothetical protein